MKENILVLQKDRIQEDLKKTFRDFLENDAFVNRTIHHLKACCCGNVNIDLDKGRRRKCVGRGEEVLLSRWLHKNAKSVYQSVTDCSCDRNLNENYVDQWIENLHCYADYLPKFGSQKKLIWLVSEDLFLKPEDDLGLLGALKRLVEWHGVRIYLLCPESMAQSSDLQSWCDILYAEVLTPLDNLALPTHRQLWTGSVTLTGSQGSTLELAGFSLCSYENSPSTNKIDVSPLDAEDTDQNVQHKEEMFTCVVVEDKLELIAPVSISEVPIYFLADDYFSLSIPSRSKYIKKSRHFLQKLMQDSDLGYILRLYTGTSWRERTSKEASADKTGKKEAKAPEDENKDEEDNEWIKLISNNISNVFIAPKKEDVELTGETGYYQFLVYEGSSGEILAQMMRNTNQINPSLVEDLQKADELRIQNVPCLAENDEDSEMELLLSDLPHWRGNDLIEMHEDIERFQASILHYWICEREEKNESTSVTPELLLQLLESAKKTFLQFHKSSYVSERPQTEPCVLVRPKPTSLDDPYSQLERTALLIREAQEERAQNGPCGLSPPKARVLTLDARQFLKFFKKDGNAAKEPTDVTVQKSPKRRFCKYDSGDLRLDKWPKCKFYRYHDIYYHSDALSEHEDVCEKMKARLISMETDSTCTLKRTRSTLTVQKDVRKLRQRPKEEGVSSEESDTSKIESSRRPKPKTPRAKKKADAALMEKRKR